MIDEGFPWDNAAPRVTKRPPCGTGCPGECGYDPNDPDDPCAIDTPPER